MIIQYIKKKARAARIFTTACAEKDKAYMKVAICTLGCKVNQYETQALEQELMHRGHTLTDFEETADIYVVNTCSVTAVSDKKSRQMLRQAKRRNPAAVIAACGCYAQTHPEDVKNSIST